MFLVYPIPIINTGKSNELINIALCCGRSLMEERARMTVSYFGVKNWEKFQHYKDRSPPWIKLYNSLLDDYEFTSLPDLSRWHLIAIWLLASRANNKIPYDSTWVGVAIKATSPVDLDLLLSAGFILKDQCNSNDASAMLARRKHTARPEREAEQRRAERIHPRKILSLDKDGPHAILASGYNSTDEEFG